MQNVSTRAMVSTGDNVLINGFIVTGADPKTVVLRALGPSLSQFGVSGVLADPLLSVYNSSGTLIATNDNWQTDIGATFIEQNGLAPGDPAEAATLQTNLAPGAYTMVVRGNNSTQGVSLAEAYEIFSPGLSSLLTNVSGRGFVGTDDNVIASNDNWQEDNDAALVQQNGLAPPNALDSALVLHLPAGAYTAIVSGVNGATGNALVEVYHLN